MRKLRTWILLLVIAVCASSCINVIEELFLNKNGSGQYVLKIDMSDILSNPMFKSLMEEGEEGSSSTTGPFGNELGENADTTINVYTMLQEEGKTIENPDFWKRVNSRVKSDEEAGEMFVTFTLDFNELNEIAYFFENMEKVMPSDGDGDMFGPGGIAPASLAYTLKKRTLTRNSTYEAADDTMDEETANMMKMFFAGATYKTIYHLPGRVKSADFTEAEVDKKKVTVTVPLVELMEGDPQLDGSIKFRRR